MPRVPSTAFSFKFSEFRFRVPPGPGSVLRLGGPLPPRGKPSAPRGLEGDAEDFVAGQRNLAGLAREALAPGPRTSADLHALEAIRASTHPSQP